MSSEFVCRLGTPAGDVIREVRRADDAATLRRELTRAGYHVFDLQPRGLLAKLKLPAASARVRGVPMRPFLIFNQELAALLRAGLPLLQGLDLLHERALKSPESPASSPKPAITPNTSNAMSRSNTPSRT